MWLPLAGSGVLGWGTWRGAETPSSSEGTSAAELSLQILNHHMWVQGPTALSPSLLPVSMWLFFIILVTGLLFS